MFVDDDLIENLRKALDAHTRTGSRLELLSAASEIVESAGRPVKIVDRDGDVWTRGPNGSWTMQDCLDDPRSLEYVEHNYGPTRPYNREG